MKVMNRKKALCSFSSFLNHAFFIILLIYQRILSQTTTSVLKFKGKLTFQRIGILLNDLKTKKEIFEIQPVQYKKLLTLMIEVLENILKYSDQFDDFILENPAYLPEFDLIRNDTGFVLIARNPVRDEDMAVISQKIEKINISGEEELKSFYRETITNGIFSEKGGAGLGFIEMAKIADHDLNFSFNPAASGFSIFELILHINHIDN